MGYYRIKIDELNNGDKRYTPQFSRLIVTGKWIKRAKIEWFDFSCGALSEEKYALEKIEGLLKIKAKQKDIKIKSTYYKIIN